MRPGRAAVLVAVALATGCGTDCTPPPGAVRPNVVLVTIDTLRADHLACYGNREVRTPELDRLAAEGVLFERAYSQTHVTVPSHVTLLSSLPLADHGVERNHGKVERKIEVLPDVFARAGYRTAAFVSVSLLGPHGALGPLLRSADEYDSPPSGPHVRAEATNARVFHWLRGNCATPFFAWIHYYDPHMPYTPPRPFDRAYYTDDPYAERHTSMRDVTLGFFLHELTGLRRRLAARAAEVRALKRELGVSGRRVRTLVVYQEGLRDFAADDAARARLRGRLRDLEAAVRHDLPYREDLADWLTGVRDVSFPLAQYRGEVSYVDAQVGRLRAELERLGIAGRTIVMVTADHGESLGEHGIYFDHFGLHEPTLHVPLIVWAPGRVTPARRTETVRGLDVAPTLLALAGLGTPAAMQGRNVLGPPPPAEPLVAEAAQGRQIMIREGPWKLIRTLRDFHYVPAFWREAGTRELYRLDDDPGEQVDVLARHGEVADALETKLAAWMLAHGGVTAPTPAAPSPAVERALRALGYAE
jgi:hypothetical protein